MIRNAVHNIVIKDIMIDGNNVGPGISNIGDYVMISHINIVNQFNYGTLNSAGSHSSFSNLKIREASFGSVEQEDTASRQSAAFACHATKTTLVDSSFYYSYRLLYIVDDIDFVLNNLFLDNEYEIAIPEDHEGIEIVIGGSDRLGTLLFSNMYLRDCPIGIYASDATIKFNSIREDNTIDAHIVNAFILHDIDGKTNEFRGLFVDGYVASMDTASLVNRIADGSALSQTPKARFINITRQDGSQWQSTSAYMSVLLYDTDWSSVSDGGNTYYEVTIDASDLLAYNNVQNAYSCSNIGMDDYSTLSNISDNPIIISNEMNSSHGNTFRLITRYDQYAEIVISIEQVFTAQQIS
jgi:hypothetical protein